MLEKHIKSLELDSIELGIAKEQIEKLTQERDLLLENIQTLNALLEQKELQIIELNNKYLEEIALIKTKHENEIISLKGQHKEDASQLNLKHEQQMNELNDKHLNEIEQMENEVKSYEERHMIMEEKFNEMTTKYDELVNSKMIVDSRLLAFRKEYKLISDEEDFTSEVSFNELEQQFKVFRSFFIQEWGKTKKRIKKSIFKNKPI